jgi:hypothetical protein
MAGKFSIYKYVKLAGKGWRYARAAYHPNGKIKLMQEYEPKSVDTMMMCVVTFFNRWLKIKLGMEESDWPEYNENDPEPYLNEEIVAMERVSTGVPKLLLRLFR